MSGIQIVVDASGVLTSASYTSGSTDLVIPRNVVEINYGVFATIRSIVTSLYIPNTVTKIEYNQGTPWFRFTTGKVPKLVSVIFEDGFMLNDVFNGAYLSDYTWGNSNFSGCSTLRTLHFNKSNILSLGTKFAYFCSSLIDIRLPENLTYIGIDAFNTCSSLNTITIPKSVLCIDARAFKNCSLLTSVILQRPSSMNLTILQTDCFLNAGFSTTNYRSVSDMLNMGYTSADLTTAGIPSDVITTALANRGIVITVSNAGVLTGYTYSAGPKDLVIPTYVTSIGSIALANCPLTSVTIPDSVTSISNDAFNTCSSLTSITIPITVTSIGDYVFQDCSMLNTVNILGRITSIGDYVFDVCYSLTSITIPDSVISIGDSAFNYCSSLTSVTIPNSVTSIGPNAFYGCSSLTNIILQRTNDQVLTTLSTNCFLNTGFTLTKYQSVLDMFNMGYTAEQLITAGIPSNVVNKAKPSLDIGIQITVNAEGVLTSYSYTSGSTDLVIPSSVTSVANNVFLNFISLTSITIPSSVTSIGSSAFQGCSSLSLVTLQRSSSQGLTTLGSNCFLNVPLNAQSVLQIYRMGYTRHKLIKSGIPTNTVDQVISNEDGSVTITMYYYFSI